MDKELLHKYFSAKTNSSENEEILKWATSSDENKRIFDQERLLWNTLLFSQKTTTEHLSPKTSKNNFFITHFKTIASSAAVISLIILSLHVIRNNHSDKISGMQTVHVPVGQRTQLLLPDSSTVWLNSNTTLSYSSEFHKHDRIVYLNGEANFEVNPSSKNPFTVITTKSTIVVTGTIFNVYDYADTDFYETSVSKGSVTITTNNNEQNDFSLKANQQLILHENQFNLVEAYNSTAEYWTNGILSFDDMPIDNVFIKLSAYYNKTIISQLDPELDYRCTAKFHYNDGLDYILNIIRKDLHFNIQSEHSKNMIIIY